MKIKTVSTIYLTNTKCLKFKKLRKVIYSLRFNMDQWLVFELSHLKYTFQVNSMNIYKMDCEV